MLFFRLLLNMAEFIEENDLIKSEFNFAVTIAIVYCYENALSSLTQLYSRTAMHK